jgi:hypothetical protein
MTSQTTPLDQRNKRPILRTANSPERPYFYHFNSFLMYKTMKLINEEGGQLQYIARNPIAIEDLKCIYLMMAS